MLRGLKHISDGPSEIFVHPLYRIFGQIFGQVFGQVFVQVFGQVLGKFGKNTVLSLEGSNPNSRDY